MATAKPPFIAGHPPGRQGPRRQRLRRALIVLAALIMVAAALFWPGFQAQALLGAADGARMACTCRYIEGRSLADCARDFEPGMALVRLSEEPGLRRITAQVPLVASQTASFHEGPGCLLQRWKP